MLLLLQRYASQHAATQRVTERRLVSEEQSAAYDHNTNLAGQHSQSSPNCRSQAAGKRHTVTKPHSNKSQSSGNAKAVSKQRKRRHETPAHLADPLAAFARQVTQRQRTLHSGLSLLQGKASQPCLVATNMSAPVEQLAAPLDDYRFRPERKANKKQIHHSRSAKHEQTKQLSSLPQHCSSQQQKKNQQQEGMDRCKTNRTPSAPLQSPSPSQHSISHKSGHVPSQALRQVDDEYFKHIKSSLRSLVEANHAIPLLHTMSSTDRAGLTSILTNKLDGVNVLADLQQHFLPKPDQQTALPSAASSVDCTPSPESVVQRNAEACKLPNRLVHQPHTALRPALPVRTSHTFLASAASSGSGHMAGRPTTADAILDAFGLPEHEPVAHQSMQHDRMMPCQEFDAVCSGRRHAVAASVQNLDWYGGYLAAKAYVLM